MKISLQWINDYVEISDLSPETIEDIITTKIAEAEGVEGVGAPLEFARLVTVVKLEKHPKRDNLQIATVYDGSDTVKVICGAPNIEQGQFVGYLPPESRFELNATHELGFVERKEIGGIESPGFIGSERELGLSGDERGIFVLNASIVSGMNLETLLGERLGRVIPSTDFVIEIDNKSLTHRPDLWSHFGFARELSAILHRPLRRRPDLAADISEDELAREIFSSQSRIRTAIDPGCGCRRFAGVLIEGASAFESPLWLRRRLYAVGAGVRNILVDLSNYVMNDVGQPNHTYDAARVVGPELRARLALEGELFVGLDGVERRLSSEDMVIADKGGAVALAGVIGGAGSAIGDQTTAVFLESANFDPISVRRSAKRYGIRTDASNRFEKSQSPMAVPMALTRYVELLHLAAKEASREVVSAGSVSLCGGSDEFIEPPVAVSVHFSMETIRRRLGAPLADDQIANTLRALGFRLHSPAHLAPDAEWICDVPFYRSTRDISLPEDLVEEVGRIYGYDNIEERAPSIISAPLGKDKLRDYEDEIRDLLRGAGFSETYNYSFLNKELAASMGFPLERGVKLQNPVDSNADYLRVSLIPGLFEQACLNAREVETFGLFELGRAYQVINNDGTPLRHAAHERRLLGLVYAAGGSEALVGSVASPVVGAGANFYALSGILSRIIHLRTRARIVRLPATVATASSLPFGPLRPWMHPYRQAVLDIEGVVFGVIAEAHPSIGEQLPPRTVFAEIDLETVLKLADSVQHFAAIPRFPESFYEISVVMGEGEQFMRLEDLLQREFSDEGILRRVEALAVYQGAPIPVGQKSVSVKLTFGLNDRTLTGDEIKELEKRVLSRVDSGGYALR